MGGEACKDCIYIKNLELRIKVIEDAATDREKRLKELEIKDAKNEEKINNIFVILGEIKSSIADVSKKLDTVEKKPGRTYEKLAYEAVKYIVIAVIAFALAKIF